MPDDMRELWQKQELEQVNITIAEIRRQAGRLERRVSRRNLAEYAVGILLIGFFSTQLWRNHGWSLSGPILMIAGIVCMLFQLHRRTSAQAPSSDAGLQASIVSYRRELERQRDALRSVFLWYLLPIVPGVAAAFVEAAWTHGIGPRYIQGLVYAICIFAAIWAANHFAARGLDRQISQLKDMEER